MAVLAAFVVAVAVGCGGGSERATTTTTAPALTLEALAAQIVTLVPANLSDSCWPVPCAGWECKLFTTGPLAAGSVAACGAVPAPIDGEGGFVTALVLDGAGTFAVTRSGLAHPLLMPSFPSTYFDPPIPAGLNCTTLLAPDSLFRQATQAQLLTPEQIYFAVVMYYFTQGRTPLMDIDDNGIPCETLIDSSVVDTIWAGGWIASMFD